MIARFSESLVRLRALSPWAVAGAAYWKIRAQAFNLLERAGGYHRLVRRGEQWASRWSEEYENRGGISAWLDRAGAGVWWVPDPAHEWAARTCTPDDLALATRITDGVVDLLGSGPVSIGNPPRWRRDLYTGHEWSSDEASTISLVRGDGSDIRTVCELSRCYHFLTLARAYWSTGERRYADTFEQHVRSWRAQNPLGYGPFWTYAASMDLALRLANWALAVPLFAAAPLPIDLWRALLAELVSAGHFLERHPEWHPTFRGSHYVGAGVGLVYLGVLFRQTDFGERWLASGARLLSREILRQIEVDGVSFERALAYHRHHTELFAFGAELIRRNCPAIDMSPYDDRLQRMYAFIDAYLPVTDEAPMLGDADDSHLHTLHACSLSHPRRHRLGLPDRHWPGDTPRSMAFHHGGYFILRDKDDHAIVRCGPIGLGGAGSHDHNDQLSFELVLAGRRVIADSGTYAYTRDLVARHVFRGTAAHNVVQVDGEEQNPISASLPWRILDERTRSACLHWCDDGPVPRFEGRHQGYTRLGVTCRRRLSLHRARRTWRLVDWIEGGGAHEIVWRLHLTPGALKLCVVSPSETRLTLPGTPAIHFVVKHPEGVRVSPGESRISNAYGLAESRPMIEAAGLTRLPARISCTIRVEGRLAEQPT